MKCNKYQPEYKPMSLKAYRLFYQQQYKPLQTTHQLNKFSSRQSCIASSSTVQDKSFSRIEVDEIPIVAIDCEFAHYKRRDQAFSQEFIIPAQICIVDQNLNVIFNEYCYPDSKPIGEWVGGVKPWICQQGMSLGEAKEQVKDILSGCKVTGHSINCDLSSLGIQIDRNLNKDLNNYSIFKSKGGRPRKLQDLYYERYNEWIQLKHPDKLKSHDAAEDATAAMRIYLDYIHNVPKYMTLKEKEAMYFKQIQQGTFNETNGLDLNYWSG